MHMDKLERIAKGVLKTLTFPLLIETATFAEAVSFDIGEVSEFSMFRPEIEYLENLIGAAGTVTDKQGEEYDIYMMYTYEDKVFFLTLVYIDKTYTYDFDNKTWRTWDRENN